MHYTATVRTHPPPQVAGTEYYELSDEEVVPARGSRPPCLGEPRGPQERDQPRTVEQFAVYAPMVQILDAPVPQLVEQLPDILHFFDTLTPVPEQVIEVPKIVLDGVPVRISVRDTQLVEQLVEVPTIISYASLLQRTMEQHVDIPVPGGGGRNAGLQGFPPEQSLTASGAEQIFDFSSGGGLQGFLPRQGSRSVNKIGDVPASGAGLQDFLPGQGPTAPFSSLERISEQIVEQTVDIPAAGGGLAHFLPGQSSSSSSHDPARIVETLDEPGEGVFRTFPQIQKSAHLGPHSSARVPRDVSSSTPAPHHRTRLWDWVMITTDQGPYYWDRRTGETRWTMEAGYAPSWFLGPDGRYVRLGNGEIYETLDGL